MNIQLTAGQQQHLIELYRNLQSDNVTIQMNSKHITVQTSLGLSTIEVPSVEQTQRRLNRYIMDACNPEIDFDAEIMAANDLATLITLGVNPEKTHSQQLLALSYAWEKVIEKRVCKGISITKIRQEMKTVTNRNVKRLFEIAQRAKELFKVIGDFPPPKFRLISPHWIHSLTSPEFERFLKNCKDEKNIISLAGARN
jgi:hypothetical protein